MRADMIEHMQLVGIEEAAALLVAQEGIVLPGIPQAQHHIDEFIGARIAIAMGEMGQGGEVLGFQLGR